MVEYVKEHGRPSGSKNVIAFSVHRCLADHTRPHTVHAWPSHATIADASRIGLRSVKNGLDRLVALGQIENAGVAPTGSSTIRYRLVVDVEAENTANRLVAQWFERATDWPGHFDEQLALLAAETSLTRLAAKRAWQRMHFVAGLPRPPVCPSELAKVKSSLANLLPVLPPGLHGVQPSPLHDVPVSAHEVQPSLAPDAAEPSEPPEEVKTPKNARERAKGSTVEQLSFLDEAATS